jgi:transposase
MTEISRIGFDLAKRVFQVHGVNAQEEVVVRRTLRRNEVLAWFGKRPPCLIGIEACATAHYWGRELARLGHTVRLIPPAYVKAYVRRNKTDAIDAAAICEAVSRPAMRFVEIKTPTQQAISGTHKVRQLLVKQRTAAMNCLRGLIAEFGIVAPQGMKGFNELLAVLADASDARLPEVMRTALNGLVQTLSMLALQLEKVDKAILDWGRSDTTTRRLLAIPGLGPITATAVAARTNPKAFDEAGHFAASLGLVPRQDGTGGKVKQGSISKRGDGYLRRLLVNGAMAVLRSKQAKRDPWLVTLLAKNKPLKVIAVALANKNARIIWALMVRDTDFRPPTAVAA